MNWILSKITGVFSGGIPWLSVGLVTLLVSGLVYEVHLIKVDGASAQTIAQLKADAAEQKAQDDKAIAALKEQYQRDMDAIKTEKDNAIALAQETQKELDGIQKEPQSDSGPIRPVLSRALDWLRHPASNSGDASPKDFTAASPTATHHRP